MCEQKTASKTPFLDSVKGRQEAHVPKCGVCKNLKRVGDNLFGCGANDKLLIPEFLPTKCKNYISTNNHCPICGERLREDKDDEL